jgi:outer membrane autotransporter protein
MDLCSTETIYDCSSSFLCAHWCIAADVHGGHGGAGDDTRPCPERHMGRSECRKCLFQHFQQLVVRLGADWHRVLRGSASDGNRPKHIFSPATNTLNQLQFLAGAPTYSIGVFGTLNLVGGGVTENLSGNTQNIVVLSGGTLNFTNNSTAGDNTIHYGNRGGAIVFNGSTAGSANFENQFGGGTSGTITFINGNAGSSVISNDVGVAHIIFQGASTAGSATINNATTGSDITLQDVSTGGNATINNGALLQFFGNSTGGNAAVTNTSASAVVDFSGSTGPTGNRNLSVGSLAGPGNFFLGANEVAVGSNNLSTTVSGVISDCGATGVACNIPGATGGSLTKVGTGTLTLSGANTYSGPTNVNTGILEAAATNTFSPSSAVTVASGGTLNLNGFDQTLNNGLTNAGTVQLPASPGVSAPGTILTVNNYVGNNGTLVLNTFLGADNSPSDQLVVNHGTATGTTSLNINNVGGPGLETTANGILVVNAINDATTAAGAFTLDNPELRAGAFDYRLFQGGINGSDPNDWFLRSSFIVPPVPPGPVNPIGPDPPPATLPPGVWPIIGPELATDGVVQPIARQMGLQMLGTLHQRVGDTLLLADTGGEVLVTKNGLVTLANTGEGTGIARSDWARFFGQGIDNRYQAFAAPGASGWMGGFQGGVDLLRTSFLPGHRDVAGVYLGFANSDINVNGLVTNAAATGYVQTKTGTLGLSGYSAGGYWTHYGPTGWYVDLVLQGTYYQGNAITGFANLPINGSGFISSLEGGYPIPLPLGPRFVLEPEAQIIFQQVAFNQANDGLGPVGLGTTSGETGRVGLRGMWTINGYNGQVWQPYGLVNLWRDWGAEATTMFGIDPVPLIEEATRLEFAGGVTALLGRGVSLYAQAGYQFALDNVYLRNGIQGDIGLRYVW